MVENISQPPASDRANLLTLTADDGKEPRRQVKTSSIAYYFGPSEHTQTELNAASGATRNVPHTQFLLMCKSSEGEASVFALRETLYIKNKPYCCKSEPCHGISNN